MVVTAPTRRRNARYFRKGSWLGYAERKGAEFSADLSVAVRARGECVRVDVGSELTSSNSPRCRIRRRPGQTSSRMRASQAPARTSPSAARSIPSCRLTGDATTAAVSWSANFIADEDRIFHQVTVSYRSRSWCCSCGLLHAGQSRLPGRRAGAAQHLVGDGASASTDEPAPVANIDR
jgi:hypothetical protein